MKRRTYLKSAAVTAAGITGLSGCIATKSSGSNGSNLSGTLRVATYSPFVNAPSSAPGPVLKKEFEKQYPNATLEWKTPDSGINYYIQRRMQGADLGADVYVGLNTDHLIRIDDKLGGKQLFASVGTDQVPNASHVKGSLEFDPKNRAIPYDTGYISLVYDATSIEAPTTFDDLLKSKYKGKLLAENAQNDATGKAFLLWTIHQKGADGYLDYWKQLVDNDVRILGTWDDAYTSYSNGEAPMVVSYSTDQVYAHKSNQSLQKHSIGFLDDQAYANPEGMAKFADTGQSKLADAFLNFMLSKQAQAKLAVLNVQFPATDWADPGEEFSKYAKAPKNPVTFSYDRLKGNVDGWVNAWAQQIAAK